MSFSRNKHIIKQEVKQNEAKFQNKSNNINTGLKKRHCFLKRYISFLSG